MFFHMEVNLIADSFLYLTLFSFLHWNEIQKYEKRGDSLSSL